MLTSFNEYKKARVTKWLLLACEVVVVVETWRLWLLDKGFPSKR